MSAEKSGLRKWLWERRSVTRLAFMLQLCARAASSLLGLFWVPLLVDTMGVAQNSLFLAINYFFSFGGLGDLGMGGVVGIRTGQMLGAGKEKEGELKKFLASARSVFLLVGMVCGLGMVALSSELPRWFRFHETLNSGPLQPVFAVGGAVMALVLFSSYLNNVNYACGNITWPVLPDLIILQLSLLAHWWLAREQQMLWIQFLPYVAASIIRLALVLFYVRVSHPALGTIFPLGFDRSMVVTLFEGSFWLYLCSLGNMIYRGTDALMINAGFAPGTFAGYNYNYRFCDLAIFICFTASYVSLPKITQWMASSDPNDQARGRVEMRRLNQFQTLLGCGAALAYLAVNNIFMRVWFAHRAHPIPPASLDLQLAFALNLAVTASGDAGIQVSMRSGKGGFRFAGLAIGLTGLLNLALSYTAMKMGSLWGVAFATVIAQSVLSLVSSFYICGHLKLPWGSWILKGWLVPLLGVSLAGWLKMIWPTNAFAHIAPLIAAYAVMLGMAAWGLGINAEFIREELKLFKKYFIR